MIVNSSPPRRDRIAGPQAVAETPRGLDEQLVAGRVPELVVDLLEVIEIDEKQRKLVVEPPPTAAQGAFQAFVQERAVGQAGERIVEGAVKEPALGLFALGDVAVDAEGTDPAVRDHDRIADDRNLHLRAVLALARGLVLDRLLVGYRRGELRRLVLQLLRDDEIGQRPFLDLVERELKKVDERAVAVHHPIVIVEDDGAGGGVAQKLLEERALASQLGLDPPVLADVARGDDQPADHRVVDQVVA